MSGLKRRCGTCRYFQDAGMGGAGWCTHPKRQVSSDVRILVRPAELACRNAWGVDFWEAAGDDTTAEEPDARSSPEPDIQMPPEPSYDDEVTSVVNADVHRSRQSREDNDIIVEQSIREPDENEIDEDDERFDLLAYGGRDSVSKARNRMLRRRQPSHGEDADEHTADDEEQDTPAQRTEFAPNDFVEDENPSKASSSDTADQNVAADEDVVISENAPPRSPRSRRIRRSREQPHDPKGATERKTEANSSPREQPPEPAYQDERGPFDTVPKVSSEIDLSRLLRNQPPADEPDQAPEPTPARTPAQHDDSYDRALKRAQSIKAAARAEREARQKQQQRPIEPLRASSAAPVPTEAPAPAPAPAPERSRISTRDWDTDSAGDAQSPVAREPARDTEDRAAHEPLPQASAPVEDDTQSDDPSRSWWRGMFQRRIEEDRRAAELELEANASPYAEPPDDWYPEERDSRLPSPYYEDERDHHVSTAQHIDVDLDDPGLHAAAPEIDDSEEAYEERPPAPRRRRQREYSPLDLSDQRDMNSYRDRLFASEDHSREQREPARSNEPTFLDEARPVDRRRPRPAPRPAEPRPRHEPVRRQEPLDRPTAPARPPVHRRAAPQPDVDPDDLLDDPSDAWYEADAGRAFDVRDIVAERVELLDMTIEIAPEVPRACATCRSYRQSDNGERGWCTNNWAFTHRQMVNATDLACKSTIGCWWLPADEEVWLDTSEPEYEPTPRVDRLVAHLDPLEKVAGR